MDDDHAARLRRPVAAQLQRSQLRWVTSSPAGATGLAENSSGLPIAG